MNTDRLLITPTHLAALIALTASCMLLSACETVVARKAEDIVQTVVVKTRAKGERRLADADDVKRELACGAPGATPARLESSEVLPMRVKPGSEINHRVVVSACPASTEALSGTLTRRFVQHGKTLFEDSEPYTLKPGRWSVNVFVGIPAQAMPGSVRLELRFERRGMQIERASDFTVLPA